ncbi:MAG: septum site-determining protein [Solirubrobacterales bacterium]
MTEVCNGPPARDCQRGQAQLELVAGLPLLLLAGLISLQLLAVGYAQSLADGAAEAGAIAAADGRDAEDAALAGLPGWAASRIRVDSADGQVEVSLDPPALLPGLGSRLGVSSSAYALPGEQGG